MHTYTQTRTISISTTFYDQFSDFVTSSLVPNRQLSKYHSRFSHKVKLCCTHTECQAYFFHWNIIFDLEFSRSQLMCVTYQFRIDIFGILIRIFYYLFPFGLSQPNNLTDLVFSVWFSFCWLLFIDYHYVSRCFRTQMPH